MINSIIEAISITLDAEFGYEIHSEEIKQDLKEPCFFIASLNLNTEQFLGNRYFKGNSFVVQFFPKRDDKQYDCNDVAERMTDCLEYITCIGDEKPIRGTGMKYEVVDSVLNFFVNYDLFVIKPTSDEEMETMESSTTVKEGD